MTQTDFSQAFVPVRPNLMSEEKALALPLYATIHAAKELYGNDLEGVDLEVLATIEDSEELLGGARLCLFDNGQEVMVVFNGGCQKTTEAQQYVDGMYRAIFMELWYDKLKKTGRLVETEEGREIFDGVDVTELEDEKAPHIQQGIVALMSATLCFLEEVDKALNQVASVVRGKE